MTFVTVAIAPREPVAPEKMRHHSNKQNTDCYELLPWWYFLDTFPQGDMHWYTWTMDTHMHTHTHTHTHTHMRRYRYAHIDIHTHTQTNTKRQTHKHTDRHTSPVPVCTIFRLLSDSRKFFSDTVKTNMRSIRTTEPTWSRLSHDKTYEKRFKNQPLFCSFRFSYKISSINMCVIYMKKFCPLWQRFVILIRGLHS